MENESTAAQTEVEQPTPKSAEPAAKKPRSKKKLAIVLGIVAVALVAGGLAFWDFHSKPEFCNAICHHPQDSYNPTYYAQVNKPAVDKWGNEVSNARGMLAPLHRVAADANCLSCHQPTLKEQMSEGIEWLTGNFRDPLPERSLEDLVRWHDGMAPTDFCLNEACHNKSTVDLTAETADFTRNPHSWHHTEYTCSDCHKAHRASIMVCTQCHVDAEVPAGWLTWEEAQNLPVQYIPFALESIVYGE